MGGTIKFDPNDKPQFDAGILKLEKSKKGAGVEARAEIIKSMFSANKTSMIADPSFKETFGKTEVSGGEILGKIDQFTQEDPEKINALWQTLYSQMQKQADAENQYTQGVIKRVNLQIAALTAQEDFNKNMHETNATFRSISNLYKVREQTMGRFMSQAEKNELNYNKSINSANQAWTKSMEKNKFESKQSLIASLKPFEQSLGKLGYTAKGIGEMKGEEILELYKKT